MFDRLIRCFSLTVLYVLAQTTEDEWQWTSDSITTEATPTEYEHLTQTTEEATTEYENITQTTDEMTTAPSSTCPPVIDPHLLQELKNDILDQLLAAIADRFDALEERLSALSATEDKSVSPPVRLSWQIYENLRIPLTGWTRMFDEPFNHKTRSEDLSQSAGLCHNDTLVGATFNGTIVLAAAGPASVLSLNTNWNQPQQFGQVYWYKTTGKSFGFAPSSTIRQTSGDNEDLINTQRLSWLLDQNIGGYRVGALRSLHDNALWRKIIYCN